MGTILNAEERKDLLVRHKGERDGRVMDRIKAVLLRDDGMSCGEIARVLFLSDEGVRQQIEDYLRQNGKLQPENGGSEARLTDEQAKKLEAHLDATLSTRIRDIVQYVKETFGVAYSIRGLTKWLQQHGFTYHKPGGIPAKAAGEAQKAWIVWYETFKKSLQDQEIPAGQCENPVHGRRASDACRSLCMRLDQKKAGAWKSRPTAARGV